MCVPKVIHYCWFGGAPLPKEVQRCISSWKKYCPDYTILRWDESNFDVNEIPYTREAYGLKRWAFVSDYARLKIICEQGGIYLDTDVELIKPLDNLIKGDGFLGLQSNLLVATGLGFGAVSHHPVIKAMMEDYHSVSFLKSDGMEDFTPCPDRNTRILEALGLKINGFLQYFMGLSILPADYLSPMDWETGKITLTENTYSIHHYHASWLGAGERRWLRLQRLVGNRKYHLIRYQIFPRLRNLVKK